MESLSHFAAVCAERRMRDSMSMLQSRRHTAEPHKAHGRGLTYDLLGVVSAILILALLLIALEFGQEEAPVWW